MAGLRLGFAVFSSEETARKVYGWGAPWQVSGPAQAAALAILGAGGDFYIEKTKSYIADQRFFMEGELEKLGFSTVPGCANYILFRGPEDLGGRLAKRGFSIRDCSDYRGLKIDRENMERSAAAQKGAGGKTAGERYYRIAVKKEREKQVAAAGNGEVCEMAVNIMIQGTMSNAGKSLIAAGLCRIFAQDGYRVAPFKSQNMALNSCVTEEGLEMGRAQAVQAEACGVKPSVLMNPVLLKPSTDVGSQVIVMGKVRANMKAADYFRYKKELIPEILEAYRKLEEENDIIVIEGAGSPAEINLKRDDIVNMGLAELVDAPVLLVGDIDRGGVFAQLAGTVMLLEEEERRRIRGNDYQQVPGRRVAAGAGSADDRGDLRKAGSRRSAVCAGGHRG